jgi:hypothetical protein
MIAGLGADTLAAGERELTRLLALKKARLGVLIEETRAQVIFLLYFILLVTFSGGVTTVVILLGGCVCVRVDFVLTTTTPHTHPKKHQKTDPRHVGRDVRRARGARGLRPGPSGAGGPL